jgi:alkylation response protein AidB-like acyl-CoA dehydrogenase
VATRLLTHERSAVGGGSKYTSGRSTGHDARSVDTTLTDMVRAAGREHDQHARHLLAEAHVRQVVGSHLIDRITRGMAAGKVAPPAGSLLKLFAATNVMRRYEIGIELAGEHAAAWPVVDGTRDRQSLGQRLAETSLWRQGLSLGGGSNEIQRNIISERLLGMPREYAADRDIPYREVRRSGNG